MAALRSAFPAKPAKRHEPEPWKAGSGGRGTAAARRSGSGGTPCRFRTPGHVYRGHQPMNATQISLGVRHKIETLPGVCAFISVTQTRSKHWVVEDNRG